MITYYSANRILDRNFGSVLYTPPATLYIGLSTTPINIDGTGATEPSGGSYTRVGVTNDKTTWSNAVNGTLLNSITITFPESTASWGTITYAFIADALSGGNIWFYDTLTPSKVVQSATTVLFQNGSITHVMNNT